MTQSTERLSSALADRYRILSRLGEGGMATVYLAEDLKHKRQVAVKVLKPELAAVLGAERFVQEITTTAGLQHPHILPLFDSGEADSFLYYVMPYIEGETLRAKLDRETQLGIDEAVKITTDVADALDYAHRHGIIHRDIKPENILLHDGRPMVADFGIALAVSAAAGGRMTETGLSLGTPHYMSPEQATAEKEITARSDVYSLGSVLYEMLAGEPPHMGNSAQQIIMKIIAEDAAPVTALRKSVPANIAAAVARSLAKLPADRFASASEFSAALADPAFSVSSATLMAPGAQAADWRQRIAIPLMVAVGLLVLLLGWAVSRSSTPDSPVMRFALGLADDEALFYSGLGNPTRIDILPDGSGLVYVGVDSALMTLPDRSSSASGGGWKLWYRSFDQLNARPIPGTEGAWGPAVSPNGAQVAFTTAGTTPQIKVISLAGGPPLVVSESEPAGDLAWGPDGWLYFIDATGLVLQRVSAGGGEVEEVVSLQGAPGVTFSHPLILPNGRGIIAAARQLGRGARDEIDRATDLTANETYELHFLDLESGESRGSVPGVDARYAASGHLVYLTAEGTLMAAPFDQGKLVLSGQPRALVSDVEVRANGWNDLSLSTNGTLVYATAGFNAPEAIVWVTRAGEARKVDRDWTREIEFEAVAVSPSGGYLAVEVVTEANKSDIWIKQLDTGPLSRLTFSGFNNRSPVWTPDGQSVTFISEREKDGIWNKRADGSGAEELVLESDRAIITAEWSRNGAWLIIGAGSPGSDDILAFRPGVDSAPNPIVASPFNEFEPALSPDGRYIAYVSDESGQREIYLRPFPNTDDGKWLISGGGGIEPTWSADGQELLFRGLTGQNIHVVDLTRGPSSVLRTTTVELPRDKDYEVNSRNRLYDVSPDGRFVMIERAGGGDVAGDLILVQNFFRELEEKVGR